MKRECPKKCRQTESIVRHGRYFRTSDSKFVNRFKCLNCETTFSSATNSPYCYQKKRRLNPVVEKFILSKTSERRTALILGINRKTVARSIQFLAARKNLSRTRYLLEYCQKKPRKIQFDDLITYERTKCLPVAVSLVVEEKTRKILDFEVSPMAANGKLSEISIKKYGKRKDGRRQAWNKIFRRLQDLVHENAEFKSDEHPLYPDLVRRYFTNSKHHKFKGRRGCVVGQGELKSGGYDPIFSLNHTCAMIRDAVARLVRRTWCTTKKLDSLRNHLEIYIDYHNRILT